jgi:hypothetical protein
VLHAKLALQRSVELAIAAKADNEARDLRALSREFARSYYVLFRRWHKYKAARAAGDEAGMATAAVSHRGGHNRAFTAAQEELLKASILSATPAMGHRQIREAALQLKEDIRVAEHGHRLRHDRVFSASDGFVSSLKQRCALSSHRTAIYHISKREIEGRDLDDESLSYALEVRNAIEEYGPAMVINMDEVRRHTYMRTGRGKEGRGLLWSRNSPHRPPVPSPANL